MARKFGRNYVLTIEKKDGSLLTITPPFTLEFDIIRNNLSSVNQGQIRIYNLSQLNRNAIQFNKMNSSIYRRIELRAGYGQNMPIIFSGNYTQCFSVREGVNWITEIDAFDGGFAFLNGFITSQFVSGTTIEAIINAHAAALPFVTLGKISTEFIRDSAGNLKTISKGRAVSDSAVQSLKDLVGENGFFIDNGKLNTLTDADTLDFPPILIDSSSGLLGTPIWEETNLTFSMLFEPYISVGQQINLQSATGPTNTNGIQKVTSVTHRGIISGTVAGECVTTVGMLYTEGGTL